LFHRERFRMVNFIIVSRFTHFVHATIDLLGSFY